MKSHLSTCKPALAFLALGALLVSGCSGNSRLLPSGPGLENSAGRSARAVQPLDAGSPQLYVSNTCGSGGVNTVAVFAATDDGNVAPAKTLTAAALTPFTAYADRTGLLWTGGYKSGAAVAFYAGAKGAAVVPAASISGSNVGAWQPTGILRDRAGITYVADFAGNRIAAFSSYANGNAAPARVIAGSATGLSGPFGMTFDSAGNLTVANIIGNSVETFHRANNGNSVPIEKIAGAATTLNHPRGVAYDGANNLYVANTTSNSILVFAPNAAGNAAPIRKIAGANTGLKSPVQIAVDSQGFTYVTNQAGNSVAVFSPGANGNVMPVRTIAGASTGLACPSGLSLTVAPEVTTKIFVGDACDPNSIFTFPITANGNVAPSNTISGNATFLQEPFGMFVDLNGAVWSGNFNAGALVAFGATATGNAIPSTAIYGSNLGADFRPTGVFRDAGGQIYTASFNENKIVVLAPNANGNAVPLRVITGAATGLNTPIGLTLDAAGEIVVANYAQAMANAGSIETFALTANGNAAPLRKIAGAATQLSLPRGTAFDAAGNMYVANPGSSSILVFAPNANGNVAPIRTITGVSNVNQVAIDSKGYLFATQTYPTKAVVVYAPGANGAATPVRAIVGNLTHFICPGGLALH